MCCNVSWLWTFCNLDFLLLSTLFLLPVYGLTAGVDTVLRVSLLLSLICILSHLIPNSSNYLRLLQSFSQIGLFALLWALPVSLLPHNVVWLYGLALEILGPVLFFQEVLFVIIVTTDFFNYLFDLAEDDDDNGYLYNGIITAFSLLSFAVASYITFTCFNYCWLPMVILAVTIFNSFLMWVSKCGQFWESSVTFLLSTLLFLAMHQELKLKTDVQDTIQILSNLNPKDSFIEFIFSLWLVTADKLEQLRIWLSHFLTPVFVISFFTRLFSVNWLILNMPSVSSEDTDMEVDVLEEEDNSWLNRQSALLCKLCTIFVLTQLICSQLYELTGRGPLFQHDLIKAWLPDQLSISRILQIALVNITLQHSIFRRWQEGDTRDTDYDY